jgi:hypothetical protein
MSKYESNKPQQGTQDPIRNPNQNPGQGHQQGQKDPNRQNEQKRPSDTKRDER